MISPTVHFAAASRDSSQIDLFPTSTADPSAAPRGISAVAARASISPGWWRVVSPVFERRNEMTVHRCEDVDGELILAVTSPHDDGWLAPWLQTIRDAAARLCGCCAAPGQAFRATLDGPTRRVCARCRDRLRAGESYLAIADDYWHLDGSSRATPLSRTTSIANVASLSAKRPLVALPPDELRQLIREIRDAMAAEVVGQDESIAALSLLGALHVGAALPRGARALLLGPSGAGKNTTINSLRRALEPFDVKWLQVAALNLTSSGWAGAPSLADLVEQTLAGDPPDSPSARRMIVVIDELHHAREVHGSGSHFGSSSHSVKRQEVLASLLSLAGGETLRFEDGREWSSREALVMAMGAFSGLLDVSRGPVMIRDLVASGIPIELCTRLASQVIVISALSEHQLIHLLRRWPELLELTSVCTRLGYRVRILEEALRRAARVVALGHDGSTPRTAGGWLVSALRAALIAALADPTVQELLVSPDSLPIAPNAMRPAPPDDPPSAPGGWDTTIVLTPR